MPILDFDKLTPDNQAVKDLKDLIQLTVFQNEDMERFMTFMPNVTNGKKAGFIGEMEDIGVAGSGCDPEYKKVAIAAAQKEWEIGDWHRSGTERAGLFFCINGHIGASRLEETIRSS